MTSKEKKLTREIDELLKELGLITEKLDKRKKLKVKIKQLAKLGDKL